MAPEPEPEPAKSESEPAAGKVAPCPEPDEDRGRMATLLVSEFSALRSNTVPVGCLPSISCMAPWYESMMSSWCGAVCRIDLPTGEAERKPPSIFSRSRLAAQATMTRKLRGSHNQEGRLRASVVWVWVWVWVWVGDGE